jgi:endonuclease/exonuclease/phosphatase family metal-dependent hydrolase
MDNSKETSISKRELYESDLEYKQQPQHLIKIMSYNVWDAEEYWEERIQHVIRIVKDNAPDVCCLLEATANCYKQVLKALETLYIIFQVFIEEGDRVGTILLCRRGRVDLPAGSQPYYYDYNIGEGRVIGVDLILLSNNEKLHVLCTKLDDHKDNDHIRCDQFKVIQKVIKGLRNCIVAGDFNIFNNDEAINREIMVSKLYDSWIKLGCPLKVKYTFDGKRNAITPDRSQLRASRIYYSGSHLNIRAMSLVGIKTMSKELDLPPSCHYGIIATFQSV